MKILKNIFYKNRKKSKQVRKLVVWVWAVVPKIPVLKRVINFNKLKRRRKIQRESQKL